MGSFAIVSLALLTAVAIFWYLGVSLRDRQIEMGKFFGRRVSFRWPSQPLRFGCGLLFYLAFAFLMAGAAATAIPDVDPPLWAAWPGILGPIAAIVLGRRHWGEPADPKVVEAVAAGLRAGERQEAQKLVERVPAGCSRRLLEAALRLGEVDGLAPDYRTGPRERWTEVTRPLEGALDAEKQRGRLRLIPAAAPLGACLVLLVFPPRADGVEAWALAGVELGAAGLALGLDRRRSRHQDGVLAILRSS